MFNIPSLTAPATCEAPVSAPPPAPACDAPAEVRTLRSDKGVVVETALSDREAFEVLRPFLARDEFIGSLCSAFIKYGGWTHNRAVWAHKKALEILENELNGAEPLARPAPSAPATLGGDLSPIVALFAKAKEAQLKWPRITFANGVELALTTKGRNEGKIAVTNGRKGYSRAFYGYILPDGRADMRGTVPAGVVEFLCRLAADPAGVSGEEGKKSGRCCYCRTALTDDTSGCSVQWGYGPVCAKKWGLPHGRKAAAQAGIL